MYTPGVQQSNEIIAWAHLNVGCHMQLLNLIHGNVVLCIKENKYILDISLDMCIFLLKIVTMDNL